MDGYDWLLWFECLSNFLVKETGQDNEKSDDDDTFMVSRLGFLLGWVLATVKNVSDKNGIFFDAVNYINYNYRVLTFYEIGPSFPNVHLTGQVL